MSVESGKELFRLGFLTAIEVPDRGYVGGLLVTNQFGRPLEFQCTAPLKPNRTQEILYGPTLVPYVLGDLIGRTLIEKIGVKPHLVLTERHELLGLRDLIEIPVACVDDLTIAPMTSSPVEKSTATNSTETPGADELVPAEAPISVVEPAGVESPLGQGDVVQTVSSVEAALKRTAAETAEEDIAEPKSLSPPRRRTQTLDETDGLTMALGRQMLRFHAGHANDRSVASRGAHVVPDNADLREPFERVREALGETARLGGAR